MTTLNNYEFWVADLLHDPMQAKWSLTQLDSYINEARRQLVMDTGCLRSLQQSYLTQSVEQYTFGQVTGGVIVAGGVGYTANPSAVFVGGGGSGVAALLTESAGAVNTFTLTNNGGGYSSAPIVEIIPSGGGGGVGAQIQVGVIDVNTYDILNVSVYIGAERYSLIWQPFRTFSARYRPYLASTYNSQPRYWSVYGDNSIFIAPAPDQSYAVEIDTIVLPTPLADYTTSDPIATLFQDPIKFYAAHLAKSNAQSYGESETLLKQYQRKLLECNSAYTGRMVDPGNP